MTIAADALVIGLGGNVGGEDAVRARFVLAREALAELGELRSAPLYRTAPIGPAQPSFLNTAVRIRVADATPDEILATVRMHEQLLGRDRNHETRWGPRTIDLDVLLWGDRVIRRSDLEVPHPRLAERRFVLRPLIALLGADTILPGQTATLAALEQRVATQVVDELAASW